MRGKGKRGSNSQWHQRITPAYAGKRRITLLNYAPRKDHPRVCGEKLSRRRRRPAATGSPPRMRGKVCTVPLRPLGVRITPAYAGKRLLNHSDPLITRGSPPRMRGKVRFCVRGLSAGGITPAYAGKSLTIPKLSTPSRDHPRVCGEKCAGAGFLPGARGSPPRMRGKERRSPFRLESSWITPAYAGKSCQFAQ